MILIHWSDIEIFSLKIRPAGVSARLSPWRQNPANGTTTTQTGWQTVHENWPAEQAPKASRQQVVWRIAAKPPGSEKVQ